MDKALGAGFLVLLLDDPPCYVLFVCVTVDDYEDDEDEERGPAAAAGAKQPLSAAKDTVGKLAEKASNVAGVSSCPSFLLGCATLHLVSQQYLQVVEYAGAVLILFLVPYVLACISFTRRPESQICNHDCAKVRLPSF